MITQLEALKQSIKGYRTDSNSKELYLIILNKKGSVIYDVTGLPEKTITEIIKKEKK